VDCADREWIRAVVRKAHKKLAASRLLLREGCCEDAPSRAYYAAFHCIQALLRTEGEYARTHKGALTADYDAYSEIDESLARSAIAETDNMVRQTEIYLSSLGLDLDTEPEADS